MRKYLIGFFTTILFMFTTIANAADDAAVTLLKEVTTNMTTALTQQHDAIQKDPNAVLPIINKYIVPAIDFETMSKQVLARHWRTATPTQRADFQKVFSEWAVLTYASAFLHYTDEKIEFGQVRPIGNDGKREEVRTLIKQNNGKNIPVNYRMLNTANGWKAYDINVENVSLVTSFRTQIDAEINKKGLDKVITDLAARNQKGLTKK
jgi:phospholipid transport system substrate-binding protein